MSQELGHPAQYGYNQVFEQASAEGAGLRRRRWQIPAGILAGIPVGFPAGLLSRRAAPPLAEP